MRESTIFRGKSWEPLKNSPLRHPAPPKAHINFSQHVTWKEPLIFLKKTKAHLLPVVSWIGPLGFVSLWHFHTISEPTVSMTMHESRNGGKKSKSEKRTTCRHFNITMVNCLFLTRVFKHWLYKWRQGRRMRSQMAFWNKAGSLKKKIEQLIGSFDEKEEKGTSAFIIRWSAVFILMPPVATCHFRNPFKIPFPWKIENCLLSEVNQRERHF